MSILNSELWTDSNYNIKEHLADALKRIINDLTLIHIKKILHRSKNDLDKNGDVSLSLKPILDHLPDEIKNLPDDQLKDLLFKDFLFLSRLKRTSNCYILYFSRFDMFKQSFPSLMQNPNWWKSNFLKDYEICIKNPALGQEPSIREKRCNYLTFHLIKLLKSTGAKVNLISSPIQDINQCRTEDEKSSKILKFGFTTSEVIEENMLSILCGPIIDSECGTKSQKSMEDYILQLKHELELAAEHKQGSIDSESWPAHLSKLSDGCFCLQMMLVSHLTPLKVSFAKGSQNTRAGAFILYNYARISTLLRTFESRMAEKDIPEIPKPYEVDFSLLKQSEEWELFWVFIHGFPELIKETAEKIIENLKAEGQNKYPATDGSVVPKKLPRLQYPTHSIAKFLHKLVHKLSIYYNRIHILPS